MQIAVRPTLLLAGLLLSSTGVPVQAQEADDARPWELRGELGGSVFFGASEQSAVTFRTDYGYEASHLEFEIGGAYDYGETQNSEGEPSVAKRSWAVASTLDYQPESHFSPFLIVNAEGSFARQIDHRISGGVGAKYRFVNSDRASLDLSLAVLAERTTPREVPGVTDGVMTKGRWSSRFRGARTFREERIELSFVTFYRPTLSNPSENYTLDFETGMSVALTGAMALKVTFQNLYDSLAEDRGARSNHDGRFFVSIQARL